MFSARISRSSAPLRSALRAKPAASVRRGYASAPHAEKASSDLPWVIGSLAVFGPMLFYVSKPAAPGGHHIEHAKDVVHDKVEQVKDMAREHAPETTAKVEEKVEQVKDKAANVRDKADEKAAPVKEKVEAAKDKATEVKDAAGDKAAGAFDRLTPAQSEDKSANETKATAADEKKKSDDNVPALESNQAKKVSDLTACLRRRRSPLTPSLPAGRL